MKNSLMLILITCFSLLVSCQTHFNQKIWLENNQFSLNNPRFLMVDDLISNHLKKGMSKQDVLNLLGKAYKDSLDYILPKGLHVPDSLTIDYNNKPSDKEIDKIFDELNKWYNKNHIKVPILKYSLGSSLADPIFLEIRLDNDNNVVDFWVKEH